VKTLAGMQKTFSTLPLVAKAVLLGLIYWVVYATASADTQPFIYFQF
jgi:alginate O-acetyltransferase complex protein AlgI